MSCIRTNMVRDSIENHIIGRIISWILNCIIKLKVSFVKMKLSKKSTIRLLIKLSIIIMIDFDKNVYITIVYFLFNV